MSVQGWSKQSQLWSRIFVVPPASESPKALESERGLGVFSPSIPRDVDPPNPTDSPPSFISQHRLHLIITLNKPFAYRGTR